MSIVGKKYGRLIVIEATEKRTKLQEILYRCKCECGKEKLTTSARLKNGTVKSCGCYNIETSRKTGVKARKSFDEKFYRDGTFTPALDFKNPKSNNNSGYTGISFHNRDKKWVANIKLKSKRYYLGAFTTIQEALQYRQIAEKILFHPVLDGEDEPKLTPAELREMIIKEIRGRDEDGN